MLTVKLVTQFQLVKDGTRIGNKLLVSEACSWGQDEHTVWSSMLFSPFSACPQCRLTTCHGRAATPTSRGGTKQSNGLKPGKPCRALGALRQGRGPRSHPQQVPADLAGIQGRQTLGPRKQPNPSVRGLGLGGRGQKQAIEPVALSSLQLPLYSCPIFSTVASNVAT